jgi:DNA-binding Lrp family transcriptional regulator
VIGRPVNFVVEISLQSQSEERLEAFERAIAGCPEVMECHLMAGDFDYYVRVAAADTQDYEQIRNTLSRLPGVARMRSSLALRTVLMRTAFRMS